MNWNFKCRPYVVIAPMLLALTMAGRASADDIARFDGTYVGPMTLLKQGQVGKQKCGSEFNRYITIKNGSFTFPYNPSLGGTVHGAVTDAGVVAGKMHDAGSDVSVTAQLTGDTLTGEGGSEWCYYKFVMKKKAK